MDESKKTEDKPDLQKEIEHNLADADQPNVEDEAKNKKPKDTRKFYKKPLFWIGIAAVTIGVISITLGLIYRNNVIKSHQAMNDAWFTITQQANDNVVLANKVKQTNDFNQYSNSLHTLSNTVSDKQHAADKMPTFLTDTAGLKRYKAFLSQFGSYISQAASDSDNISNYDDSANTALEKQSSQAEQATSDFKNNANYVKGDMPTQIYKIPSVFESVIEELNLQKQQSQAAAQKAAAQTQKDAADKQTVTTNVNTFEQGFIAGNAGTMRAVMTSGFQSEYNFTQLNPDQRQYQYPSSFRVIEVTKQNDGTYKAQVNVIYKYTENSNQYTQGFEYSVINSNNNWLLNNEKLVNSF